MDLALTAAVPLVHNATKSDGRNGAFIISGYIMSQHQQNPRVSSETAAKNKRLAIILALVALAFYVGFILLQMSK
jgi:hypothetical protein